MTTAPMIEWTLLLLEWIKGSILEEWPQVRLRGNSPELENNEYSIRFREGEEEYWMVMDESVIRTVSVEKATQLLFNKGWVGHLKRTGCLHIGLNPDKTGEPELHPCPYLEKAV